MKRTMAMLAFLLLGALLLKGCATSRVAESHPLFAQAQEPRAVVYFLRPDPQRSRGISDADLKIELEHQSILELSRGEYTRLELKPIETDVIIRSLTHQPYKAMPSEAWRARRFNFEAGKTYYILARFQQEEFRGVYFIPTEISVENAEQLARLMTPAGTLAKAHPLYNKRAKKDEKALIEDVLN